MVACAAQGLQVAQVIRATVCLALDVIHVRRWCHAPLIQAGLAQVLITPQHNQA